MAGLQCAMRSKQTFIFFTNDSNTEPHIVHISGGDRMICATAQRMRAGVEVAELKVELFPFKLWLKASEAVTLD